MSIFRSTELGEAFLTFFGCLLDEGHRDFSRFPTLTVINPFVRKHGEFQEPQLPVESSGSLKTEN